jgi:hypothetical protein
MDLGKFYKTASDVVKRRARINSCIESSKELKSKWQKKRCTRQSALIVERNAKFRSSLTQADQFTVENVGPRKETREEDSKLS